MFALKAMLGSTDTILAGKIRQGIGPITASGEEKLLREVMPTLIS